MNARETKLLLWLQRKSPLLESQIVGSGLSAALNSSLMSGWADMIPHPSVREHGAPAAGVIITEKGKTAIGAEQ